MQWMLVSTVQNKLKGTFNQILNLWSLFFKTKTLFYYMLVDVTQITHYAVIHYALTVVLECVHTPCRIGWIGEEFELNKRCHTKWMLFFLFNAVLIKIFYIGCLHIVFKFLLKLLK